MGAPLMVIGGLVSAASSVMAGQAQSRALQHQAAVAEQNRKLAQVQAAEALKAGAREEHRFRRRAEQFQATQLAQLSASGAQLTGSPLAVIADTAGGIEEDVAQIRYNALMGMWGHEVQATSFANEAMQARAAARSARRAGWIGAGASLLTTGAQLWGASHSVYNRGGTIGINAPRTPFDPGFNGRPNR